MNERKDRQIRISGETHDHLMALAVEGQSMDGVIRRMIRTITEYTDLMMRYTDDSLHVEHDDKVQQ